MLPITTGLFIGFPTYCNKSNAVLIKETVVAVAVDAYNNSEFIFSLENKRRAFCRLFNLAPDGLDNISWK